MYRPGLVLLCSLALSGCAGILPIPTAKHTPDRYGTRGEIEKQSLRFIDVGATTREDVLLRLGEPDATWDGGRYFAYRWITVNGYVVMWALTEHDADGTAPAIGKKRHDLVIEFDDDGLVCRYGDVRKWASTPHPVPPVAPVLSIPVQWRKGSARVQARLSLEDETLTVARSDHSGAATRIELGKVRKLHYQAKQDARWHAARFACTVTYLQAEDKVSKLRFYAPLSELPALIDYLEVHAPQARITN